MSCTLAFAAALILADPVAAAAPAPVVATAPVSVASEPMFADLVARSGELRAVVDGWIASGDAHAEGFGTGPAFTAFRTRAADLAERDMAGHRELAARGTDGDLKCILRGIAEDMPKRLDAVRDASNRAERDVALAELSHLLNDNAEVILAPPAPEA